MLFKEFKLEHPGLRTSFTSCFALRSLGGGGSFALRASFAALSFIVICAARVISPPGVGRHLCFARH